MGKKPSFIDLGCGNGLLVHILGGEGFRGTGLDIRKRKIWESFPRDDLKVRHSSFLCSYSAPKLEVSCCCYRWKPLCQLGKQSFPAMTG